MNKGFKLLAVTALVAAGAVSSQNIFANCQTEGPYEVRQCARGSWFARPPVGAGTVEATWWAVGFGNRTLNSAAGASLVSPEGSGFLGSPSPGQFLGVDAGLLSVAGLNLVDATTIPGLGATTGTTCFSSSANWGVPGVDSCIDVNRTAAAGGGTSSLSDGYINRYWASAYGPGPGQGYGNQYLTLESQLDPPMGVLLTESTGLHFAAAFFATTPKNPPVEEDLDPGQYSMADLVNGETNQFGPVVVPWQPVPQPVVAAQLSVPSDPASTRNLQFTWSGLSFIHDGSTRPCLLADNATACASVTGGVGALDQGSLIHFEVESTPIDAIGNCGTVWTLVTGSKADPPATSVAVTGIPQNTCVRLKTSFGRTPLSAFRTVVSSANLTANRLDAQRGRLGDLGYFVISTPVKVGGTLVSQKATLKTASREKGSLRVAFDTDSELNVTGFDVVGIDGKGGRQVLGTVRCSQCTTGLSGSYDELIPGAKLQGAKQVQIVMQPSGIQSNTLSLK